MKTIIVVMVSVLALLSFLFCGCTESFEKKAKAKNKLTSFTESFDDFGITMRHPQFKKLVTYGFDRKESPATKNSGILMAGTSQHTIDLLWVINPFPGEMSLEEESRNMKLRLTSEIFEWGRTEVDIKKEPIDSLNSPVGHRVFFQKWSYKDAVDRVYRVTICWYCKESRRIFQLDIFNTSNDNDLLIKEYLDGFRCHR